MAKHARKTAPPPAQGTTAGRAREMAARIERLPHLVAESFAGGRPLDDRVAMLTTAMTEIRVGMVPAIGWVERREHPDKALLLRARLEAVLRQALACVQRDIPEYVTGTPQKVSEEPSKGAHQNATLTVMSLLLADWVRGWANDIEAEERMREEQRTGQKKRRASEAPAKKVHPATLAKAILFERPDISPTQLAEEVGVSAGTLYKKTGPWKDVRAILIARRDKSAPRGSKDRDGNIEAWEDDREVHEGS